VYIQQVYLRCPRDWRLRKRSRDACEIEAPDQPSPIIVEELHNDISRALAITVNDMLSEGLRGDEALDRIVEDIQPVVLFHPDVRPYSKFYKQVRDIFLSLGVNVHSRRGYPIIKALAYVYPEVEILNDALACVCIGRSSIAPPSHEASSTPHNDNSNYSQRDSGRALGYLPNMSKDNSFKYDGTIKENFQEALTSTCA
jgi:hypothetical protein